MTTSPLKTSALVLLALLVLAVGSVSAQTPPDKYLGFKVGEDRKLADYTQIKGYFEKLAQESNKIKLFTIGESVQKKPIIMAAISTPENLAKIDRWKEILHRLRDPRATSGWPRKARLSSSSPAPCTRPRSPRPRCPWSWPTIS